MYVMGCIRENQSNEHFGCAPEEVCLVCACYTFTIKKELDNEMMLASKLNVVLTFSEDLR